MLLPPGVPLSVPPSASNAAHTEALPGLVLAAGRYRLIAPLGTGGFGRVWRALDTVLNVEVAIKEVSVPPGATPEETTERVERAAWEARNAAKLRDHPNIVTVHDVVIERGVPWTIMQYVPGCSLADEIKRKGPVSVSQTKKVATAMLAALGACHEAGIIHRDIKPHNIMLADNGTVMLTDFGIAKQAGQTPMTAQDLVIGSMPYMAPERARGKPAIPGSDLFSLGVTLYHAVEGISPFDRGSGMASLAAILLDELPQPTKAGELAPLIRKLTKKDPDKRLTAEQAVRMLIGEVPKQPKPPVATAETQIIEASKTKVVTAERKIVPGQDPSAQRRIIEARRKSDTKKKADAKKEAKKSNPPEEILMGWLSLATLVVSAVWGVKAGSRAAKTATYNAMLHDAAHYATAARVSAIVGIVAGIAALIGPIWLLNVMNDWLTKVGFWKWAMRTGFGECVEWAFGSYHRWYARVWGVFMTLFYLALVIGTPVLMLRYLVTGS